MRQPFDGTEISGQMQGWTAGYPRISLGDILVDAKTREVWAISQVNMTTHKRVVTKQEIMVDHYDEDDATYKILERMPKNPERRDMRHGEIIF